MNRSAALGSLVGYLGWALALLVLLLGTAPMLRAFEIGAPCLFGSLGSWAFTVFTVDVARQRFGDGSSGRALALVGAIAFSIGVLLQLYVTLVMPELQRNDGARSVLDAMGSTTLVPEWVPLPLLAGGSIVLAVLAWRSVRSSPGGHPAQNQPPIR
ncbi:MAG: hypothetical protein AB7I19_03090 [Planctomycetota bacterium]